MSPHRDPPAGPTAADPSAEAAARLDDERLRAEADAWLDAAGVVADADADADAAGAGPDDATGIRPGAGAPVGAAAGPAAAGSSDELPGAAATDALFAALYGELHRIAAAQMRREPDGHTLGATALAHEAWLRLRTQDGARFRDRGHFLAVASLMMRRILVNHARARRAAKREAALLPLTLAEAADVVADGSADVVRVHEVLLAFEQVDRRAARVVELKFFGGLEVPEIAAVLGVSAPTVKRDWAFARAWLDRELRG